MKAVWHHHFAEMTDCIGVQMGRLCRKIEDVYTRFG